MAILISITHPPSLTNRNKIKKSTSPPPLLTHEHFDALPPPKRRKAVNFLIAACAFFGRVLFYGKCKFPIE